MRTARTLMVSLLAVFALGAVAATAAQAVIQGPFWKVCKNVGLNNGTFEDAQCSVAGGSKEWEQVRLKAAGTEELEAKTSEGEHVLSTAGGLKQINCTKVSLGAGSVIEGKNGGNEGQIAKNVKVEYRGCSVVGNGTPCAVTEPLTTAKLIGKLGYAEKNAGGTEGKGKLLIIFEVEAAPHTLFATVNFTGTGCMATSTQVTTSGTSNGVIAELLIENSHNAIVAGGGTGTFEKQAMIGDVNFPATTITKMWYETALSTFEERKGGLAAFGVGVTLQSDTDVNLASDNIWGVFT